MKVDIRKLRLKEKNFDLGEISFTRLREISLSLKRANYCYVTPFCVAGRREQYVQDAVGHKLHIRFFHANLRKSTAQLAIHAGLQTLPRLHDTALSHEILSRIVGSSYGNVARSQWR